MAIEIKKQKLLKDQGKKLKTPSTEDAKKQRLAVQRKREEEKLQKEIRLAELQKKQARANTRRKILATFFIVIISAMIIYPKPRLITYEKLQLASVSIYVPDGFNDYGKLTDSDQIAIIDEQLNILYLCTDKSKLDGCLSYKLIESGGTVSVIWYWLVNHPLVKQYLG